MGDQNVSIAQIPIRIIKRYTDNFKYLVSQAMALVDTLSGKKDDSASITPEHEDSFGFKKTLVLLTKPNKVIAISSENGSIQWTYYCKHPIIKVFVEQMAGSNDVHDIIAVTQTNIVYLDPVTGAIESQQPYPAGASPDTHDFMLVEGQLKTQQKEGSHQLILAVPRNGDGG